MPNKRFRHDTIAMIYDFDGTLSPQPMQEYTVLPQIGIPAKTFWKQVKQEAKEKESEEMLVYMRLLLEKADAKKVNIGKNEFKALARRIIYFRGVERWFPSMNKYVRRRGAGKIKIRHYLVSAGVREILEGVAIRKWFKRIYASEY
jgi:haloacid dehalogenase-like hydrolase